MVNQGAYNGPYIDNDNSLHSPGGPGPCKGTGTGPWSKGRLGAWSSGWPGAWSSGKSGACSSGGSGAWSSDGPGTWAWQTELDDMEAPAELEAMEALAKLEGLTAILAVDTGDAAILAVRSATTKSGVATITAGSAGLQKIFRGRLQSCAARSIVWSVIL